MFCYIYLLYIHFLHVCMHLDFFHLMYLRNSSKILDNLLMDTLYYIIQDVPQFTQGVTH